MINQFESAFGALLNVQEAVLGVRKKVTINGVANIDAFLGILTFEEILVAGGIAENGGFEIQVAASALAAQPPQLAPVIVEGRTLYILQPVRNANGIYTLTCGDPATEG